MIQLSKCPVCSSISIGSYIKTKAQMSSSKAMFNFDQCSECKLVFLNPQVPIDQLKKYYSSQYLPYRGAKAWGKFEILVEKSQRKLDLKRVKLVKDAHLITSESLILDIGCGKPSFLKACNEELKGRTMGIDFSDEGWKEQRTQYLSINLQVAEIKDLPLNLQPDVITMWHYLEHDYIPFENLNYLSSISKPSTTLIIEVPNFDSASRKKYGKNWSGWHSPRHLSLFSPNNIELLLQKSGWKVIKIQTYGTMNPYLLYWMSEMEIKGINWDKDMEDEFWAFMLGMVFFIPQKLIEKKSSLGIMTVFASPC